MEQDTVNTECLSIQPRDVLTDLLRQGAQEMPATAIENEVAEYIERHAAVRDDEGRRLVVRNGRLPIAAGTDKFGEEIPLGSNRVYVRVPEPATYDAWLAAVKAGRGFVTNGPIPEFETAGAVPGDVVEFQGTKQIHARVRARSLLPFTTLEIVMNGAPVGHKTVPARDGPGKDGLYSMEVEATVELARSGWLAARVVEHPDLRNRILPRELSVFAHTNPIYFVQDGHKVREEASVVYLRRYVQGVLHWLGTEPTFATEQDRHEARRAAEEALRFYEGL